MKRQNLFFRLSGRIIIAVCLLLSLGSPAFSALAAPPYGLTSPEEVEAFFDSQIEAQLAKQHIPGAVVTVVQDGAILFAKGYGYASLDPEIPVEPERTLFRICSITKLFTWTAVMQLFGQGQLDLDADVNTYLDFTIPSNFDEPVTLRHLMTHTAGFEDRNFETIAASPDRLMPLSKWLQTHMPARVRRPGELSAYSNYGVGLAGYIVERVSGMPYDTYIDEMILAPLGMTNTSTRQPLPAELAADLTQGFSYRDGSWQPRAFELWQSGPAASMSATAADMARFMLAHLQNGQLDSSQILMENTAQQMHSHLFAHDARVNGFAYGFQEMNQNGLRVIGHDGSSRYFQAIVALVPDQNLGLFVAYNGQGGLLNHKILEAFLDRFYPGGEPESAAPGALNHAAQAAGFYRSTRTSLTTIEKVKQMFTPFRVSATTDGHLIFPTNEIPTEYIEVAPLVFQSVESGEVIVFRADEWGQITHIFQNKTPIRAYERLAWYENPLLHAALMVSTLLVLVAALPLTGFRLASNRRKPVQQARLARVGWGSLVTLTLLTIISVPLVGLQFIDMTPFIQGEITLVRLNLLISYALILLAAVQIITSIIAWRKAYWSTGLRIYFTVAALASVLLIGELAYWNMIGWKF